MEKYSRGQRIGVITKKLIENPNKVIGLNYFTERLNAAKSTTSEDIVIIKDTTDDRKLFEHRSRKFLTVHLHTAVPGN